MEFARADCHVGDEGDVVPECAYQRPRVERVVQCLDLGAPLVGDEEDVALGVIVGADGEIG